MDRLVCSFHTDGARTSETLILREGSTLISLPVDVEAANGHRCHYRFPLGPLICAQVLKFREN